MVVQPALLCLFVAAGLLDSVLNDAIKGHTLLVLSQACTIQFQGPVLPLDMFAE